MGITTTTVRTGGVNVQNRVISQPILGANDFENGLSYTDSGSGSTLTNMRLIGQLSDDKKILDYDPTDVTLGAGEIFGLLWLYTEDTEVVAASATRTGLSAVIKGRIDATTISFPGALTLNTVVASKNKTIRQLLNDRGFILVEPADQTLTTES